jgi:hypothetical protein
MAQQQIKPSDFTGRERARLAKEHAEAIAAREHELGMTQAAAGELSDEVVDFVKEGAATETAEDGTVTYVEAPAKTVRVNSDIDMTYGIGNNYTFKEGQLYRVPALLADHLDELGYIWH